MKFTCVLKSTLLAIRESFGLSFAIKMIGLPCCTSCYSCYLSLVNIYLATKLFVTDNSSACRKYLAKNCLSFPFAPCWVQHSYLSKGLRLIPCTCGSSRLSYNTCSEILCWKLHINSFCSSLGSTLLLIKRTTIDPLYLWVIKTLF